MAAKTPNMSLTEIGLPEDPAAPGTDADQPSVTNKNLLNMVCFKNVNWVLALLTIGRFATRPAMPTTAPLRTHRKKRTHTKQLHPHPTTPTSSRMLRMTI